jgi:hypothetical protein
LSISNSTSSVGKSTRLILRILALIITVCAVAFWLKTGAHTGFSKNRVEIEKVDPITQIEYVDYEERFIMGVEYLALSCAAGVGLFGLSYFFGRHKS